MTTLPELEDIGMRYLAGSTPLAILHRVVIGFYIPVRRDEEEVKRAVAQLGDVVTRVLAEAGMSEDELVAVLNPPS